MEFIINDQKETVVSIGRKIGYRPMGVDNGNEYSLVRELDRNKFPRFHIYAKRFSDNEISFNLHLDQKMPSYKESGAHAHSGEYEGDIIEKEAQRIKNILENS